MMDIPCSSKDPELPRRQKWGPTQPCSRIGGDVDGVHIGTRDVYWKARSRHDQPRCQHPSLQLPPLSCYLLKLARILLLCSLTPAPSSDTLLPLNRPYKYCCLTRRIRLSLQSINNTPGTRAILYDHVRRVGPTGAGLQAYVLPSVSRNVCI